MLEVYIHLITVYHIVSSVCILAYGENVRQVGRWQEKDMGHGLKVWFDSNMYRPCGN